MKRIISLGLVGILICSALVGCSEGGTPEVPASTSIASSSASSEPSPSQPASSSSSAPVSSSSSSSSIPSENPSSSSESSSVSEPPSSSEAPSESPASSVTEKKSISVSWNENYIRCKDVVTDSDKQVYVPGQGYTWGYHHYYLDIIYNITNTGNCPISLGNDAFSVAWDDEPLTDHFVYLNAQLIDPVKLSEGESAMVAVRYPISTAKYEEFSDLFAIAPHRIIHTVTFEESNFTYTYLTKLYSSNM